MNNECQFEFSFRRKDMEKLLADNPDCKLIIVKNEIKSVSTGKKNRINVITVTAYAKQSGRKKASLLRTGPLTSSIEGCPNPPGCIDDGGI